MIEITTEQIIAAAGGFTAVCVAAGWLIKIIKAITNKAHEPNERLDTLDKRITKHDELLDKDNKRIGALEITVKDANRVQNRALLQLMNHQLDGNHTDQLKAARDEMENFLLNQ